MDNQKTDSQPTPPTIWQKLSVPLLTIGVALMVFFFQWLFGMMYPQDSYRIYTNWEITELTAENLLTEKRLDGIRQTIDRKEIKNIYLDSLEKIYFSSAGKLLSADLTFLACTPGETQGQKYHLVISQEKGENGYYSKFERLEGYFSVNPDELQERVPYETLYTLSHHPMAELANQKPIASESSFYITAPGDGLSVQTDREEPALQEEIDRGIAWFVRSDGGWFAPTRAEQISPRFLPAAIITEGTGREPEFYGWLLLEVPAETELHNKN